MRAVKAKVTKGLIVHLKIGSFQAAINCAMNVDSTLKAAAWIVTVKMLVSSMLLKALKR